MADLEVTLPELHEKVENDDPIAKLLQFRPESVPDATKIVMPPAPVIAAPAPAPVIAAPAPAPIITLAHAPPMPFKPLAPIPPIMPHLHNLPVHVPETHVPKPDINAIVKSHRNIGMHWHEPGQEFNVSNCSGTAEEVKKFLASIKGFDINVFDQFVIGAEKEKNVGPMFEGKGHATMVFLSKMT